MPHKFNGYKLAQRINTIVGSAAERFPPASCTADELFQWMNCLRTVETTVNLLQSEVKRRLEHGRSHRDEGTGTHGERDPE